MKKEMETIMKKGEEMVNEVYPKVKDATQDFKESVVGLVEKGTQSAQNFFEKKDKMQDEAKDFISSKHEKVRGDVEKVFEPRGKKKNTGKVVAGVALASLAASAYAIYKVKKIKNDNLKAEYAEKLQRWAELDMTQFDTETGDFNEPIMVMPKKVYAVGSNAKLGEDVVINISKATEGFSFNPEDEGKPLADLDLKKKMMSKAAEVKEKIKEKIDETKLQSKLGSMEAKDKYVEIKDIAGEKIGDVKSKLDGEITPNIKETVKETKEKAVELKDEAKDKLGNLKEEAKDKVDDLKSNDMDTKEPDNIVDEPFGVEEIIDDVKDEKNNIVDKAKKVAESAKAKLKNNGDEKEDKRLSEFEVTVHNKGVKDYVFSPMQIQLYDLKKRSVKIKAKHEEGTTLAPVTIKPGETYTGKLYVKKTMDKPEGLIFFKDLGLKEAVVYLISDGEPVVEPELILNEDYLYSDEKVLKDEEYKRL